MERSDIRMNLDVLEIAEKTFRVLLDGRRGGMRFDDTMDFSAEEWDQIDGLRRMILANNARRYREAYTAVEPRLEKARHVLKAENIDIELSTKMSDAGLTGPELELKHSLFEQAWEAFCEFFGLKDLKKLFLLLNSYLGSLATVLPFIEGVKEFKDTLEVGVVS